MLRYYTVFNVAQCEGIDAPAPLGPVHDFNPIESAERIAAGMPKRPQVLHGEARAYYAPAIDTVNMPQRERFERPADYYSVLFHELTHATGHKSRLGREGIENVAAFGSCDYSREELVAEMGAAFLSGESGIVNETIANSAAYIGGWLQRLRNDKRLVVTAAAQAQKAADFVLDRRYDD